MKRLLTVLMTLLLVGSVGITVFAKEQMNVEVPEIITPQDVSPDPITPDTCRHSFLLIDCQSSTQTDPNTGRTYRVDVEYYYCTKCGATTMRTTYH